MATTFVVYQKFDGEIICVRSAFSSSCQRDRVSFNLEMFNFVLRDLSLTKGFFPLKYLHRGCGSGQEKCNECPHELAKQYGAISCFRDLLIELTNPLRVKSRAMERPKPTNVCTHDRNKFKTTKNGFARPLLRALRLPQGVFSCRTASPNEG